MIPLHLYYHSCIITDKLHLSSERRIFSTRPDLSQNEQKDVTGRECIKRGALVKNIFMVQLESAEISEKLK